MPGVALRRSREPALGTELGSTDHKPKLSNLTRIWAGDLSYLNSVGLEKFLFAFG